MLKNLPKVGCKPYFNYVNLKLALQVLQNVCNTPNGNKTVIAGVANILQRPQCNLKVSFANDLTGAGGKGLYKGGIKDILNEKLDSPQDEAGVDPAGEAGIF